MQNLRAVYHISGLNARFQDPSTDGKAEACRLLIHPDASLPLISGAFNVGYIGPTCTAPPVSDFTSPLSDSSPALGPVLQRGLRFLAATAASPRPSAASRHKCCATIASCAASHSVHTA